MANIYYSKRSGNETERILDKANGIKINEQNPEDVLLQTFKIGNTIYKPDVVKKKTVYIHIVELYFNIYLRDGVLKTLITIDDRSTPYVQGTEYLFFKSFGGGVLLKDLQITSSIYRDASFFCTESYGDNNGNFATYWQSEYEDNPFTWFGGTARINEDIMYRLELEVV